MPHIKHSVAGIAVSKGKVFIARRKPGGDLGGKWEFPGGKLEADESDEAALKREYHEELGIAVEVGPLLAGTEFIHNGETYLLNAYRVFFDPCRFNMTEHSEWRWAAPDEIVKLDFADSDLRLLPALKTYLDTQPGIKD